MKIRDISIKKRLLVGNFLMVFIPICILSAMFWIIFAGISFIDNGQKSFIVSKFLEEKGAAMSIQFALSSIKSNAEKGDNPKLKNLINDCKILESQGISTIIFSGEKIIYSTENFPTQKIFSKNIFDSSILIWNEEEIFFKYTSKRHGIKIFATGNIPIDFKISEQIFSPKKFLEICGIIFLICSILFLIFLGKYLSKLLSEQILEPLEKLRAVSKEIREGNLEVSLKIEERDEIGEICRDFEKMRAELLKNKNLQEKYERNRKELIAGISHDLATPLTALKGYASGILDGIANTPEKKIHYVEMIQKTAGNMENLVENLFLFSKMELGRVEFKLEKINLYDYFSDFIADKQEIFLQRNLQIKLCENKKIPAVKIDRLQFERLVENILENSIKYKQSDKAEVFINFVERENFLQISFADKGRGVERENLKNIFEIFYRTDKSRTKVEKGSGLGLAIVKQIAEGMGGKIFADETEGGGLTIFLELPTVE